MPSRPYVDTARPHAGARHNTGMALALIAALSMVLGPNAGLLRALGDLRLPNASSAAGDAAPKSPAAEKPDTALLARYFVPNGKGRFSVQNQSAGVSALVSKDGLVVRSGTDGSPVTLEAVRLGRAGVGTALTATAAATATDLTATVPRGAATEWFSSKEHTLQQGWTVDRRPAGAGKLSLDLAIQGATVRVGSPTGLVLTPTKGDPLSYNHLVVRDARGKELPASFLGTDTGARIVVDDKHARYPVVIDPDMSSIGEIPAPKSASNAAFGTDIAVKDRWMAVKEPGFRPAGSSGDDSAGGAVDLYFDTTGNGGWVFKQQFEALGTIQAKGVGLIVEPAGITVLNLTTFGGGRIEWWAIPVDPNNPADGVGSSAEGFFTPQVFPTYGNAAPSDIAVDGTTVVFGMPRSSTNESRRPDTAADADTIPDAINELVGVAQVWKRTGGFGTGFSFVSALHPEGGLDVAKAQRDYGQLFGTSVDVDEDSGVIAVGVPGDDGVLTSTGGTLANPAEPGVSSNDGAVQIFRETAPGTWTRSTRVTSQPAVTGAQFGTSVAFAGPNGGLVVGAKEETVGASARAGVGYLFDADLGTNTWTKVQRITGDIPGTATNEAQGGGIVGSTVAASPNGQRIYLGAPNQTYVGNGFYGGVYAYARAGATGPANFQARLQSPVASQFHGGIGQAFGNAVAARNDEVAVGAPQFGAADETLVGRVSTFRHAGTVYSPSQEISPVLQPLNDTFGFAMAQDGDVLAIGLPNSLRGSNGFGVGAVAVYERDGDGDWVAEEMLFPYSGAQITDGDNLGTTLAIRAYEVGGVRRIDVAVGAPTDSAFDLDSAPATPSLQRNEAGSVLIFSRYGGSGSDWQLPYKIWAGGGVPSPPDAIDDGSDIRAAGRFGQSLAFTEDGTLIVGEPDWQDGNGAVHRFDRNKPSNVRYSWKQKVSVPVAIAEGFGSGVGADDDTVLVRPSDDAGVWRYTDGANPQSDGDIAGDLVADGHFPMNMRGKRGVDYAEPVAVSVEGERFAVGGMLADDSRAVRVYRMVGDVAVREAEFVQPEASWFGTSVDLNHGGDVLSVIAGAPYATDLVDPGMAFAYSARLKDSGVATWADYGQILDPESSTPAFGFAVTNWPENGGGQVSNPISATTGRVFTYATNEITEPPGPDAFVDVIVGDPIPVGATKLKTADLKAELLDEKSEEDGSIASTAIGDIDLDQPSPGSTTNAAPLSSIPLKSIPLKSIPLKSIPLSSIPLKSIAGGWATILAGTPYEHLPLQGVLLSDVYDLPSVQELTLGALDIAGSPLKSIPLASIALGATPLKSIDLDPGATGDPVAEWCDALEDAGADTAVLGLDCANPGAANNDEVTVLSIGLRGAPLDSLPLKSIPLKSIDLAVLPLKSIPLKSIGIGSTPLKSIPLKSIDLGATPLKSIPLSSIPLKSIPLKSIDIQSLMLGTTPLKSIPLKSIDIDSTPLKSIPLKSIGISPATLAAVPLKSIPLKSIPLKSIDLEALLLGAVPLKSIPLSSIAIADTPLKSIPLKSIDLTAVPLSSIPLKSIPLKSIPLKSIDLDMTVGATPLKSIPLKSIDIGATPLKSIPLKSISAAQRDMLVDCSDPETFACEIPEATLADAAAAGAIRDSAELGDLGDLLEGMRLSDLIGAGDDIKIEDLKVMLGDLHVGDLNGFDDLTLGDLAEIWPYLTLGDIQELTAGIRLGDLADHLLEFVKADLIAAMDETDLSLADLSDLDDVTLGEMEALFDLMTLGDLGETLKGIRLGDLAGAISNAAGVPYDEDDLRDALVALLGADAELQDLGDLDDLTLGDLGEYGDATMGDLLAALAGEALENLTLADLLLALLSPRQYPWEALDLSRVIAQAFDENPNPTPVTVAYRADAPDGLPRTVRVTVQLPPGSRLSPGSVTGEGTAAELKPVIGDDTAVWTFADVPANTPRTIDFDLEAPTRIGPAQVKATSFLEQDDDTARDTAGTVVSEAFEPNDTIAEATELDDDTITLSHISSANDIDVYSFEVTEPNTRISVSLSNLDADLDAVLYAPPAGTIVPTADRDIDPTEDEGDNGFPAAEQDGSDPVQPTKGDDIAAPTDLNDLATVQASFNRGRANEQIDTGQLTRQGTYHLAVTGYNGATNVDPYALRLKRFVIDNTPPCPSRIVPSVGDPGTSLPTTLPAGTNSVFLVNKSRMASLYGATETADMLTNLDGFVTWLNGQDALGTKAAVLTVDADAGVRDAYAQWDGGPCSPSGANAVVSEINRLLNGYRTQGADLKSVVLVGGDDAIPFGRVPDRTKIANESSYASTFSDGPGNALYATFSTSSLQTNDVYVDRDPYAFGDRALYVPDSTVARLVESPQQIADQLADFRAADGRLAVETGLVTGYDFLTDGSNAVADEVERTYGSVDSTLISDTWTRQDLEDAIHTQKPDLLSVNAHFDHFRALPGLGNATGNEDDLFTAAAVRGALNEDLAGSVVFSMGCHGGLSASDKLLTGNQADRALDFAEAVSSQGGIYVGNTGYGYGDTEIVALSEELMKQFANRLDGNMSVGEAMLYAKNAYFSGLAEFTPYDEKVLMQTTFYGLPFYRLDVADPPQHPLPLNNPLVTDPATGLDAASFTITPDHQKRTAENGTTYFAAVDPITGEDGHTTVQNRPVQPKLDTAFALPAGKVSHDALVLGLVSEDHPGTDPYVFQPIVDNSGERAEVGVDTAFPTKPIQVNPGLDPSGPTYHVAATTGYFRTTGEDGTGVQRTYKSMEVLTYFQSPTNDDFTAPTFGVTTAQVDNGMLTVDADVLDDRGGPERIKRVRVLAVSDPRANATSTWTGIDLVRTAGSSTWSGSIPVNSDKVEYILQAVDAAGNVGVAADKARFFRGSGTGGGEEPPADELNVSVVGPLGGNDWYTGPVTVSASGGRSLVYEVTGEVEPTAYEGPFTLSGNGLHSVKVTSSDGQFRILQIGIDTVGPTAQLLSPAIGETVPFSTGFTVLFECPDVGSGAASCTATVDGQPVTNGQLVKPAPGNHTVTVTPGPDLAGNPRSTGPLTRTVKVVGTPTVGSITVTKPKDGQATTLTLPYTGFAGLAYSATVNWGDGSTTDCSMSGSGCTVTQNANGTGTVVVSKVYPVGTTEKTATITVSDQTGQGASASVLVNRATTLSATSAVLQLKVSLGLITLKSGAISATLKTASGASLAGETIRFTLPSGALICTATTGSNGTATCTNPTFTIGTILSLGYVAKFEGRNLYRGSIATASLIGP